MIAASQKSDGKDKLRVLLLTAPARFGGLETVVGQLSAGLMRRGHAVSVGCILDESIDPASHPLVRTLESSGVSVEPIQLPPRAYRKQRAEITVLIRRFDASIVHTHGYHTDVIGGKAALATDVPHVATSHGFTGGGWKNQVYEFLQRRSYRSAAAIIAVSRPLAETLSADRFVAPRVHVIQNARIRRVDWPARDEARVELGIERDGFVVGWLGRMSREKGPDVVIGAMADPRAADLQLCMIGDGPLRPGLERTSALSAGAHTTWHGVVPDAGRLLKAFDVVVLSSRTEGTPMVLLEAMDAGVPLVVTRVGGVPDIVGDNEVLLVAPDDPEALLTAILDVSSDVEAAKRRADRAEERLGSHFDPDAWLNAHEDLYRSILAAATAGES